MLTPLVALMLDCLYEMFGAVSAIAMVTRAVSLPAGPVPVTTYWNEDATTVGVPLMTPVRVSRDRPAGKVPVVTA